MHNLNFPEGKDGTDFPLFIKWTFKTYLFVFSYSFLHSFKPQIGVGSPAATPHVSS